MEVIYLSYPLKLEKKIDPSSMAIGFFDGIHLGHQKVIGKAMASARKLKVKSSVMTFDPHPKQVLGKQFDSDLITTFEEKIKLLDIMGLDIVYVVSFSGIFSKLSSEEFFEKFLIDLNISHITVGFDFTFGRFGGGNAEDLRRMANNLFKVTIVPPIKDINGIKISSTLIKEQLRAGNKSAVNDYLGRYSIASEYAISGVSFS